MMMRFLAVLGVAAAALTGCASLQHTDPVQVTVADIESLPSEGLEVRMLVKLRVQNPNNTPIEYNGAYVQLDVLNKSFASGVSNQPGTVPRFGEAVIGVPVTVSVLRMVGQVVGMLDGKPVDKVTYAMHGKLSGTGFQTVRFKSQGELTLPTSPPAADDGVRL